MALEADPLVTNQPWVCPVCMTPPGGGTPV
jgi:hypothetical protein